MSYLVLDELIKSVEQFKHSQVQVPPSQVQVRVLPRKIKKRKNFLMKGLINYSVRVLLHKMIEKFEILIQM